MRVLSSTATTFPAEFKDLVRARTRDCRAHEHQVAAIIERIEKHGDKALKTYARRWDGLCKDEIRLNPAAIERAARDVPSALSNALAHAAERIRSFHQTRSSKSRRSRDEHGLVLESRWRAIGSVGLYVPGGCASYPSSLLMTAIPAQVAGVERIVVATPLREGRLDATLAAALVLLQLDQVYCIGGAHAIAALALGTESLPAVDMIAGAGSPWVTSAKRQLFGRVGIDMLAGPSEVLILADRNASVEWLAADLLAQAEHSPDSQPALIGEGEQILDRVLKALEEQLPSLSRRRIAEQSLRDKGAMIAVEDLAREAPALADALAFEHVEIVAPRARARRIAAEIRNAGALFIGAPEAFGDYIAGPSHVLPTARSARFHSGLGTETFMKRTSIIDASPAALNALSPSAILLAEAEGLQAHARSLRLRQNQP